MRHGPGHNISIYYRESDDQIIELFTDLDHMPDEELGYFEPRPWHRDSPQRPKVWEPGPTANIWGMPPSADFSTPAITAPHQRNGGRSVALVAR